MLDFAIVEIVKPLYCLWSPSLKCISVCQFVFSSSLFLLQTHSVFCSVFTPLVFLLPFSLRLVSFFHLDFNPPLSPSLCLLYVFTFSFHPFYLWVLLQFLSLSSKIRSSICHGTKLSVCPKVVQRHRKQIKKQDESKEEIEQLHHKLKLSAFNFIIN